MNKIRLEFIVVMLIFLLAETALAVPQYYLFKGTIRSIEGDNTTIATRQGFNVGQTVEYLIMVDSYVMGQVVYTNGKIDYDANEVYAELVSGSVLKEKDGGYYIDRQGSAVHKGGGGYLSLELHLADIGRQKQQHIIIGNEDESLFINSIGEGLWNGYLQAYDSKGGKAAVHLDLELSTITNEIPYPFKEPSSPMTEPVAMVLFGAGLLSIGGLSIRKKRRPDPQVVIPIPEHS